MENKYYQPDISEFFVGFECETWGENVDWEKVIIEEPMKELWLSYSHNPYKYLTSYRVKYLSQEDIESLGFEYNVISGEDNGWYSFEIEHTTHSNEYFDKNGEWISFPYWSLYRYKDNKISITNTKGDWVFQGTIKNKSELKKVLQMLNIQ